MASVLDEFEEYRTRAFSSNRICIHSRDDCSSLPETQRLQAKMRMRASFKSDNAYRSNRRKQQEQELLAQQMHEMSLRNRENVIGESMVSVFDSREEIDCDFPSPDDVMLSGGENDGGVMITAFREQSPRMCHSPAHVSVGSPSVPHVPMTPSPPAHHRSKSCRVRSRRPRELQFVEKGVRRRTYSMPSRSRLRRPRLLEHDEEENETSEDNAEEDEHEFYRVRTFCTSAKGIVNRGDSFKKKPLSAQSSLESGRSDSMRQRTLSVASQDSSFGSAESTGTQLECHTVLVMGTSGVGKTSLLRQFMTSEYMGSAEAGPAEEGTLPSISVLLDSSEATLEFAEMTDAEEVTSQCSAGAFVVVYAVNDRDSFDDAVMCLHELRKRDLLIKTAVILVANKGDIVRGREVEEEEGKVMAVRYGCKYIEVSAILNLKVDDLLVGILKQIRFNDKRKRKSVKKKGRSGRTSSCITHDNGCIPQPRTIVGKIFGKGPNVIRSCDNLLVL